MKRLLKSSNDEGSQTIPGSKWEEEDGNSVVGWKSTRQ